MQCSQHELQAQAHRQDHRPEVALAAIVATAFIESGEEGPQTGLIQAEEVILSRFTNQFLIEAIVITSLSDRWGAGPGRFKACWIMGDPFIVSSTMVKRVVRTVALSSI